MSGFNKIIMMGNLSRNPEFKQLPSGQSICKLGLAVNRQIKSKNSENPIQEVCFIDIDVWGVQAESCNKFLEKGKAILVDGRLKWDSWTDSEGQRRSKHSIVADRVTFLWNQGQQGVGDGSSVSQKTSGGFVENFSSKSSMSDEVELKEDAFNQDLPF
jgi:single-strand DNA-binding protein